MKLLTKAIITQLPPYETKWESEDEVIAVAHLFLMGWDWYLVSGSPIVWNENGTWCYTDDPSDDWLLYVKGFSHMCPEGEYGDMFLSELKKISVSGFMKVEREIGWKARPIKECRFNG